MAEPARASQPRGESRERSDTAHGGRRFETQSVDELLERFETSRQGLTDVQAKQRLEEYGPNALEEKRVNPVLRFLGYFWLAWMLVEDEAKLLVYRHLERSGAEVQDTPAASRAADAPAAQHVAQQTPRA